MMSSRSDWRGPLIFCPLPSQQAANKTPTPRPRPQMGSKICPLAVGPARAGRHAHGKGVLVVSLAAGAVIDSVAAFTNLNGHAEPTSPSRPPDGLGRALSRARRGRLPFGSRARAGALRFGRPECRQRRVSRKGRLCSGRPAGRPAEVATFEPRPRRQVMNLACRPAGSRDLARRPASGAAPSGAPKLIIICKRPAARRRSGPAGCA